MAKQIDLRQLITHRWRANEPILFLVTDEPYRVWTAIQDAVAQVKADLGQAVRAVAHDKVTGFYETVPGVRTPKDGTHVLPRSVAMAMETAEQIAEGEKGKPADQQMKTLPFDPRENIIFMFRDPNWDMTDGPNKPSVTQQVRNIFTCNMCSTKFHGIDNHGKPIRGQRMLVMVSAVESIPKDLPEVTPIHIPLPDDQMIDRMVATVVDPLAGQPLRGSNPPRKFQPLQIEERRLIVSACCGFSTQEVETTLSLALVENGGYENMEAFLRTIEHRQIQHATGIKGITYIPKDQITYDALPGYELAEAFIDSRMSLTPDLAAKHNLQPLRGITLVGAPGVGKTVFASLVAKRTGRPLLMWSLGETQGGIVGDSERDCRRAINFGQAKKAVVCVDDVDKSGVGAAASGHTGDGGTFGRMVQMLLTEMSSDSNQAIWLFTANRIGNVPGELIRAGRMDERFYVQRPDDVTRLNILKLHLDRVHMTVDKADGLEEIAGQTTEGWVGAELADLIKNGAFYALRKGTAEISTAWMRERAMATTPMAKMAVYSEDIKAMEEAASQFRPIGRIVNPVNQPANKSSRGRRGIQI